MDDALAGLVGGACCVVVGHPLASLFAAVRPSNVLSTMQPSTPWSVTACSSLMVT
jgi:hypothetical protein